MSDNGSALIHLTKCRLCGVEVAHGSEVGPPIVGESPNKKRQKYGQLLHAHLAKEHREKVVHIIGAGQEFMELLGSMYFETTDPTITRDMERIRAVAHKTTQKIHMPDEVIEEGVRKLDLETRDTEQLVIQFCKAMRDALCEEGQYANEIFQTLSGGPTLVT